MSERSIPARVVCVCVCVDELGMNDARQWHSLRELQRELGPEIAVIADQRPLTNGGPSIHTATQPIDGCAPIIHTSVSPVRHLSHINTRHPFNHNRVIRSTTSRSTTTASSVQPPPHVPQGGAVHLATQAHTRPPLMHARLPCSPALPATHWMVRCHPNAPSRFQ